MQKSNSPMRLGQKKENGNEHFQTTTTFLQALRRHMILVTHHIMDSDSMTLTSLWPGSPILDSRFVWNLLMSVLQLRADGWEVLPTTVGNHYKHAIEMYNTARTGEALLLFIRLIYFLIRHINWQASTLTQLKWARCTSGKPRSLRSREGSRTQFLIKILN